MRYDARMEQQQQGYPPVGSVWERHERDGSVTRRRIQDPPATEKHLVAYREDGTTSVWHSTIVSWLDWVGVREPARMVSGGSAPEDAAPPPPIGSAWEASRPIFSRRIVVDPKTVPGLPLGWVAFIGHDEGDDFSFTMATPSDVWNRWAKDATRVSVPKPSPFAETNLAAAVEANRELIRKLAAAEDQKRLAERQLHAARQESLNLTLEARDAPELRRKLSEEVGKVIQLLGERDKAIQDREATDKALAAACADYIRQLDVLKTERLSLLGSLDNVVRERDRLRSELRDVSQQAGLAHNEKLKRQVDALEVTAKIANEEKFVQYERLRDAREKLCQAIGIIDGVEQKG
jgi:hypothetical protein